MFKLYRENLKSSDDISKIKHFSDEFSTYLDTLPEELFLLNNHICFKDIINDLSSYDEDDYNYLSESLLSEQAKTVNYVCPVASIIDSINKTYKIPKDFFIANIPNHIDIITYKILPEYWKCPVALTVPKIKGNLNIIELEMKVNGYYLVATKTRKIDDYKWIEAIFNPMYQESIRQMLDSTDTIIYHFSANTNHESIKENGIIPKFGDRIYHYLTKRSFYVVQSGLNSPRFKTMMNSIIKQRKRENPHWSGHLNRYMIQTYKLPNDIQFYWDPNAEFGVYTEHKIDFKYITDVKYNVKF